MRLIVAANRGPLRRTDGGGWAVSVGGLTSALLPVLEKQGGVWVAMQDADEVPARLHYPEEDPQFSVRSIPLSDEELDHYYYGMANTVLWPLSHYMIHHLDLQPKFYLDYRDINKRFAEAVVDEYEPGDYVWVQDYHLTMAPRFIRERQPDARIAYFWHIPWPAMEVFRILPWSRELLRGMLGSDLIGFHVDEYVENFLESARVLLGAEVGDGYVRWEGREIRVEAHPIGIGTDRFRQMSSGESVRQEAQQLHDDLCGDHGQLVVGIDRLDYTKGILSRLLAFERLLEEHPEYRGRVSFYQVATPSRTEVESYKQLKREVDEAVGRINGAYGRTDWTPVHYRYRSYTQEELTVFYRAADVALITPLRDGMNLVTQEYVASTDDGVLVLSELTGAAYLLPEALQVNPYDQPALTRSIREALEMDRDERDERLQRLKQRVEQLDIHTWADKFYNSMQHALA